MGLRSRRELLAGGLALGTATAAFGPGGEAAAAKTNGSALVSRQRDLRVLEGLLASERLLKYCFTQVLESNALKTASAEIVLVAYGHEQAHAAAVQAAITAVQGQIVALQIGLPATSQRSSKKRPAKRRQPFPPPQIAELFAHVHHEPYAIIQLARVELYVQSFYFNAVAELDEPALIRTATEILACKAQQWSLYQNLLSHGMVMTTVPSAFVRGSSTLPK